MTEHDDEARLRRLFSAQPGAEGEAAALRRLEEAVAQHRFAAEPGAIGRRRALALAGGIALVPAAVVVVALGVHQAQRGSGTGGGPVGSASAPAPSPAATVTPATTATPAPTPTGAPPAQVHGPVVGPRIQVLRMIDTVHGFAVDDVKPSAAGELVRVLVTGDGGASWRDITPPPLVGRVLPTTPSLVASDQRHAVLLVGSAGFPAATVYRTDDGGGGWSAVPVAHGAGRLVPVDSTTMVVLSQENGAAGSAAAVLERSQDGGRSWTVVSQTPPADAPPGAPGVPFRCEKTGIGFRDLGTGWVSGNCNSKDPLFLVTHDGGVHWAAQSLPLPAGTGISVADPVVFFGDRYGFLDGLVSDAGGGQREVLWSTHDGGSSWSVAEAPPTAGPVAVVAPADAIAVLQDGSIVQSGDDGRTWSTVATHRELRAPGVTAQFIDRAHGFLLVQGTDSRITLYRTDDGGRTLARLGP